MKTTGVDKQARRSSESRKLKPSIRRLSKVRLSRLIPNRVHSVVNLLRDWYFRLALQFGPRRRLGSRPVDGEVIVSLTTFPPRVWQCAVAIESIFRQTIHPAAVLLTLASEEFPGKKVPWALRKLVKRGLDIAWVDENNKSYDKLLTASLRYPDHAIITIDDDKILNPWFLEEMAAAHSQFPNHVIGYRGWEMRSEDANIRYGDGWVRATEETPSLKLFLPGNAGVLYPKGSLGEKLHRMDIAHSLSPTNDDFWFWGLVHESRTPLMCLGKPPHRSIASMRRSPALRDVNEGSNDDQFQKTIDHFQLRSDLIRACAMPRPKR